LKPIRSRMPIAASATRRSPRRQTSAGSTRHRATPTTCVRAVLTAITSRATRAATPGRAGFCTDAPGVLLSAGATGGGRRTPPGDDHEESVGPLPGGTENLAQLRVSEQHRQRVTETRQVGWIAKHQAFLHRCTAAALQRVDQMCVLVHVVHQEAHQMDPSSFHSARHPIRSVSARWATFGRDQLRHHVGRSPLPA